MYYYKYNGPQYLDNQKIKKIIVVPPAEGKQGIITINGEKIQFNETKTICTREGMYITSIGKLNSSNQNIESYSEIEIISELEI